MHATSSDDHRRPAGGDAATVRGRAIGRFRALLVTLLACLAACAAAAEPIGAGLRLVMVDDPSCVHCRKWLAEVGPFYSTSTQGRRAPLVRRSMGDPSLAPFGRLAYTPTFLLVADGREVGRLVGYGGAAEFWRRLDDLLASAGADDALPGEPPGRRRDDRPKDDAARDAALARSRIL